MELATTPKVAETAEAVRQSLLNKDKAWDLVLEALDSAHDAGYGEASIECLSRCMAEYRSAITASSEAEEAFRQTHESETQKMFPKKPIAEMDTAELLEQFFKVGFYDWLLENINDKKVTSVYHDVSAAMDEEFMFVDPHAWAHSKNKQKMLVVKLVKGMDVIALLKEVRLALPFVIPHSLTDPSDLKDDGIFVKHIWLDAGREHYYDLRFFSPNDIQLFYGRVHVKSFTNLYQALKHASLAFGREMNFD